MTRRWVLCLLAVAATVSAQPATRRATNLAALMAHPAVAAVIPGASRPERIAEDRAALNATVPADFWRSLRQAGLVHPQAPMPLGI